MFDFQLCDSFVITYTVILFNFGWWTFRGFRARGCFAAFYSRGFMFLFIVTKYGDKVHGILIFVVP